MITVYNEIDQFAAQWMRELQIRGLISKGVVDERSIEDIAPQELTFANRVHLFAGIGVWDYAIRLSKWPEEREIWTASCPCQPFSSAGKRVGFGDERHLWPAAFHLISERRPGQVVGEQVASKDGLAWLDLVQADMEGIGYTIGAIVTPAAGYGAPHGRHRIYWYAKRMADTGSPERRPERAKKGKEKELPAFGSDGVNLGTLAVSNGGYAENRKQQRGRKHGQQPEDGGARQLDDAVRSRRKSGRGEGEGEGAECAGRMQVAGRGAVNGFWLPADWLDCADKKRRPVEPGTFPLVDGAPARVGRLRGYGNAIVAVQAQAFLEAILEVEGGLI